MEIFLEDLLMWLIRLVDLPIALLTFGGIVVTSLIARFGFFRGSFLAFLGTMAGIYAFHDQYLNVLSLFGSKAALANQESSIPPAAPSLPSNSVASSQRDVATAPQPMEWKVVTQPETGVSYMLVNISGTFQRVQQVPAGTAGPYKVILTIGPQGGYQGYYANYGAVQPPVNAYAGNQYYAPGNAVLGGLIGGILGGLGGGHHRR